MNNQKISARQVKRTLTLELLGISTLLLPSLVATDSGVDGFFALTAGGGGAWLLLKFWQKHFRQQDFSQRLEQMSGVLRHGCADGTAAIGKWLGANDSADAGGSGIFRTGARTGKPGESI